MTGDEDILGRHPYGARPNKGPEFHGRRTHHVLISWAARQWMTRVFPRRKRGSGKVLSNSQQRDSCRIRNGGVYSSTPPFLMINNMRYITLAVLLGLFPLASSAEEVNVYSGRKEALIKPLFDEYTKETGIRVNLVTGKAECVDQAPGTRG